MADNSSSSSSSSESSSSSGEIQPIVSLIELTETEMNAVLTGAQRYKIGDREVERADILKLMEVRKQLKAENVRQGGKRPPVSYAKFTTNY